METPCRIDLDDDIFKDGRRGFMGSAFRCRQAWHGHARTCQGARRRKPHLNDDAILLRAERLLLQSRAKLVEPPEGKRHDLEGKTRLLLGSWVTHHV